MGVVVADGTVHLAQQLHGGDLRAGLGQAHRHVGDFLAHGGRAGGLAVRAREHRHVGELVRHFAQLGDQAVDGRQHHGVARGLDLQGVAGVVDVFAGAGEMHELGGGQQLRPGFELRLDPVFDGLHVVVGGLLDVLDGQGVGLGEVRHQPHQVLAGAAREGLELGKAAVGQRNEPGHLHLHATVHIALFAHQRAQGREFGRIAAVKGGEGGDGGKAHARILGGRRVAAPRGNSGAVFFPSPKMPANKR
ncbi:hypothetical protein D3C86_524310 [compost metagenome]